jgi:hypothetical protein
MLEEMALKMYLNERMGEKKGWITRSDILHFMIRCP